MTMARTQKVKVAACQAAPVWMNRAATIEKAVSLILEAGRNGAQLVAFPEVFLPGYPFWNWLDSPFKGSPWYRILCQEAVRVPHDVEPLAQAAARAGACVVMGVDELDPVSDGTVYNTNLVFSPEGQLIGRHRKLVPTFAEKLSWGNGDASGLRVHATEIGRIGSLICGENTNPLARFALLAQGEQIHVANYPGIPWTEHFPTLDAIKIRSAAHSFEGKIHTLVVSGIVSPEIVEALCDTEEKRKLMTGKGHAISTVFGPNGTPIVEPLIDEEGILYAEFDIYAKLEAKQFHDIIGHYNRFDVFSLHVNARTTPAIHIDVDAAPLSSAERPALEADRPPRLIGGDS